MVVDQTTPDIAAEVVAERAEILGAVVVALQVKELAVITDITAELVRTLVAVVEAQAAQTEPLGSVGRD